MCDNKSHDNEPKRWHPFEILCEILEIWNIVLNILEKASRKNKYFHNHLRLNFQMFSSIQSDFQPFH